LVRRVIAVAERMCGPAYERRDGPTNTAVATSQPLATAAAATILRHGGTAVDAAIAAALALAVAEPGNSGLGGGGFALVYDPKDKRTTALDFRERAPIGLDLASLKDEVKENPDALRNGSLAVAVPSEWDGLLDLHVGSASCR